MKTLIATGTGRYADPWHPFLASSARIAEILEGAGFEPEIDHDVDHAMTVLADVDLLVVNAGDPWRGDSADEVPSTAAIAGLESALSRGIGVIAMHCAVSSLRDYPQWASSIGAVWLPGLSFHPNAGTTSIAGAAFPNGDAVAGFEVFDERYCRLQQIGSRTVVATHPGAISSDLTEPSAWVRDVGPSRVAVDLLGHDERSYDSEGHRRLLVQLAAWVTGGQPD